MWMMVRRYSAEQALQWGLVNAVVEPDELVAEGDELVVVEAMKMEHAIRAPAAGKIRAVLCAAGDQVERGQPLVDFEPS
jgi:3-methylcrotonyl-CoA carboxylase alpha subunit